MSENKKVSSNSAKTENFVPTFGQRLGYRIALAMGGLGFGGIRKLGLSLGWLLWTVLPERRRLATNNIYRHLGYLPSRSREIARASFDHNARSFVESVLTPRFGADNPRFVLERPDVLERLRQADRPVVVASGHMGAWELFASLWGLFPAEKPRITVVRKYKNAMLNYLSSQLRSSWGAQTIGHREAVFPVLRALRKKGCVAFLVDHNTSRDEAIFLPFLGEEAAVNRGPALIAVRSNALVCPIFLLRDKDKYVLCMEEPLDPLELQGTSEEKIEAVTRFYTAAVERIVRRAPEQWFWMHNRWKTKKRA